MKVVDADILQQHTCKGIGADGDRVMLQTESNGNISLFLLPKKFNLDFEKQTTISGNYLLASNFGLLLV